MLSFSSAPLFFPSFVLWLNPPFMPLFSSFIIPLIHLLLFFNPSFFNFFTSLSIFYCPFVFVSCAILFLPSSILSFYFFALPNSSFHVFHFLSSFVHLCSYSLCLCASVFPCFPHRCLYASLLLIASSSTILSLSPSSSFFPFFPFFPFPLHFFSVCSLSFCTILFFSFLIHSFSSFLYSLHSPIHSLNRAPSFSTIFSYYYLYIPPTLNFYFSYYKICFLFSYISIIPLISFFLFSNIFLISSMCNSQCIPISIHQHVSQILAYLNNFVTTLLFLSHSWMAPRYESFSPFVEKLAALQIFCNQYLYLASFLVSVSLIFLFFWFFRLFFCVFVLYCSSIFLYCWCIVFLVFRFLALRFFCFLVFCASSGSLIFSSSALLVYGCARHVWQRTVILQVLLASQYIKSKKKPTPPAARITTFFINETLWALYSKK